MATSQSASNRILLDPTKSSPGVALTTLIGTAFDGELALTVKNTGPIGVFARLNDSTNDTSWTCIRPQTTGYLSLSSASPVSLELYRKSHPRFISMHTDRTPDQQFGAVEIHRHV
jgi:hypothetical protein